MPARKPKKPLYSGWKQKIRKSRKPLYGNPEAKVKRGPLFSKKKKAKGTNPRLSIPQMLNRKIGSKGSNYTRTSGGKYAVVRGPSTPKYEYEERYVYDSKKNKYVWKLVETNKQIGTEKGPITGQTYIHPQIRRVTRKNKKIKGGGRGRRKGGLVQSGRTGSARAAKPGYKRGARTKREKKTSSKE